MKKQINILSYISFLAIVIFLLFSCEKEEIVPSTALDKNVFELTKGQSIETAMASTALEDNFQNEGGFEFDMTYAEALKSIDPDVYPSWGVAIKSFICIGKGETLLVYNPYNSSYDFYNSGRFQVLWFKDGRPIKASGVQLECVCKGKYAVIVLNKATQQGIGIAFYSAPACYENSITTSEGVN